MEFVDELIVTLAIRILRWVMVIGTWLVYVQFFALVVFLLMTGTVVTALMFTTVQTIFLRG